MLRSSRTLHGMEWPIHGMESSIHGMLRPIHGQFLAVVWVHFYQHFFFLSHFGALRRSHGRLHPRAAVQQKRTAVARRSAPNAAARGETLKKTERRAAHFAPTWAKARPRRALSVWRGCHYFLENRGWKRRSRPPWIGVERPGGARGGGIKGVKKLQAAEEFSYICLDKIVEPNCQTHVWAPTNPPPRRSS